MYRSLSTCKGMTLGAPFDCCSTIDLVRSSSSNVTLIPWRRSFMSETRFSEHAGTQRASLRITCITLPCMSLVMILTSPFPSALMGWPFPAVLISMTTGSRLTKSSLFLNMCMLHPLSHRHESIARASYMGVAGFCMAVLNAMNAMASVLLAVLPSGGECPASMTGVWATIMAISVALGLRLGNVSRALVKCAPNRMMWAAVRANAPRHT